MDKQKYIVTGTPHIRSDESVRGIMLDVIIALMPAIVMATYLYGFRALGVIILSVASSVCFESLYQSFTKQPNSVNDLSAVVTGILLSFNLPPSAPFWLPIVGAFFAIVIIKQLFGGIGQNFMNPALGARAFLLASYPVQMTNWSYGSAVIDATTSATPLALIKDGIPPQMADYINALVGRTGGCIGETCALALVIGGLYLIARRVISWRVPVIYIGTVAILSIILGRSGAPFYEIFTGGLILGAFFMATDYSSSPVTPMGKIIFALGCGILTILIRTYSRSYPEGVSYSILLMNLTVPLIDRFTRPRVFGEVKKNV